MNCIAMLYIEILTQLYILFAVSEHAQMYVRTFDFVKNVDQLSIENFIRIDVCNNSGGHFSILHKSESVKLREHNSTE